MLDKPDVTVSEAQAHLLTADELPVLCSPANEQLPFVCVSAEEKDP